jgi:hypothetical protein
MAPFTEYFSNTSKLLEIEYDRSTGINHNLTAGECRELFVKNFLERVYPNSCVFGDGEIIDFNGNISDQADLVIYDEQMPILEYGGSQHFLTEGVQAHIEVKSDFTGNLSDPLSKTESVKGLDRYMFYSEGLQRDEVFSALFSFEGPEPETFARNFYEYYEDRVVDCGNGNYAVENTGDMIDLVCVLDKYYMFKHPSEGINIVQTGENSLEAFFVYLAGSMYKYSRGHPDLARYMNQSTYQHVDLDLEDIFG